MGLDDKNSDNPRPDKKKKWAPPQVTVLEIESATIGPPIGKNRIDGVYS